MAFRIVLGREYVANIFQLFLGKARLSYFKKFISLYKLVLYLDIVFSIFLAFQVLNNL